MRGVWVGGAGDQGVFDLLVRVERSRVWEMLWVVSEERREWMLGAEWSYVCGGMMMGREEVSTADS